MNVALEGIVPVMVHKLELDTKPMDISHPADQSTIDKLERIQKHLIVSLLFLLTLLVLP